MQIIIIIVLAVILGLIFFLVRSFIEGEKRLKLKEEKIEEHNDIKTKGLELIKSFRSYNHNNIMGRQDSFKPITESSGIYVWYIKRDYYGEILPFYVGKAKNIRSRWKQHITQVKKGLKGEKVSTKYLKVINYMQRYGLKISDLKFCILEKCNELELTSKEDFWINKLKANIFGFNSIK